MGNLPLFLLLLLRAPQGGSVAPEPQEPAPLRQYGEPCSCDSDCEFNKWLACVNGSCQCLSTTFLYDFSRQTCVIRLGQKCFEVGADYKEYKELPPSIRCVSGAFCSISVGGLCACNTYGFYEEGERCFPRKQYDAPCALSVQCKSDLCSRGKCACREGQYYSPGRDRCLGLKNTFCFTDVDCTDNSICNSEFGGKCTCAPGYQGATCEKMLSFGDPCAPPTAPCNNPQLSCWNATCLCKYPLYQRYEPSTGQCQSSVSSAPCSGDEGCVPHANCLLREGVIWNCECREGYVEMGDGSCAKYSGHGANCESDGDCDPLPPFVCKDGACGCKDSLTLYDPGARLCRGLIGYRNCKVDLDCIENAFCWKGNPELRSKCSCRPSFAPTANRTCLQI